MKKGQTIEGVVTRVDFPNKGIVRTDDGELITVKNVLEGQRILCVIKKTRKGKAEGRLLEVVAASPQEMDAAECQHFGECGGCSYQTLPYDAQLEIKSSQVERLLAPVIGEDVFVQVFEGIKASPLPFAYRNKMEFSFGDAYKDGPLALGMHKRGSFYDIVTVEGCRIIDDDMRQVLVETLAFFQTLGADYYHKMRHAGYLRNLLVRKAVKTGELLVDLVTSSDVDCFSSSGMSEDDILKQWSARLQALTYKGALVGVLHTRNDREAEVVEDQGTTVLYGQAFFYEELLGLKFRITPFSFFQTNSLGAEVLYETARSFICEGLQKTGSSLIGKTVYDLYSGTGTIAQILAPVSGYVIGVEIVGEAVEAAKVNAAENGLENCDFIAGDVLKVLDTIEEKPDYIVLDPPRDGIHPKALQKIIDYGVDSLVYISCKPTSLARDLEVFLERGYEVKRICCCDMFPGTVHVETVVLLSKGEIDSKAEVKRDLGLPMYDAPNAVEELKQPRKHPTAEKVEAIKDALKHFEII